MFALSLSPSWELPCLTSCNSFSASREQTSASRYLERKERCEGREGPWFWRNFPEQEADCVIRSSQTSLLPRLAGGMATFRDVLSSFCLCCIFPPRRFLFEKSCFLRLNTLNILVFSLFTQFSVTQRVLQKRSQKGARFSSYPRSKIHVRSKNHFPSKGIF